MIAVGDRISYRTVSCPRKDGEGFTMPRQGNVVAIPRHRRFAVVDFGGWRECVPLWRGGIFLSGIEIEYERRREEYKELPKEEREKRSGKRRQNRK